MVMKKLLECHDEGELSIIKSLLDANGIEYFVQNEHFGSLYPGISMPFNARIIMVPEVELGRAQTLLNQFGGSGEYDEAG